MPTQRNRIHYLALIIVTIGLGLGSRTSIIPEFIYPYLGDALYALMFFFMVGFLFPNMSTLKVFGISVGLCFLIEFSQLYQADWINAIRHTRLGGLILGFGFLWSDLLSYFVGGIMGSGVEFIIRRIKRIEG